MSSRSAPTARAARPPCDTWDNAVLLCEVKAEGYAFPLRVETKRIAPGETNTWSIEVDGTKGSIAYTTKLPKTLSYMEYEPGNRQAWQVVDLGSESAYPTITGAIFEFGFSDAILQMWAAFLDELAHRRETGCNSLSIAPRPPRRSRRTASSPRHWSHSRKPRQSPSRDDGDRARASLVPSGRLRSRGSSRFDLADETESRGLRGRADAVVVPETAEAVAEVVSWCYEHGVAIVPRGGGTGFAAGAIPLDGGVVVSLERLTRVRAFEPLLWRIWVEAGLRTAELRRIVRESGLFFPPDPGAAEQSQIGGNIATNAGGPHAFKYGVTGTWVTGLEAVLAPGQIVSVGGPIRKDVSGFDLKSLLIGSEGALGIVKRRGSASFQRRMLRIRWPPSTRPLRMAAQPSSPSSGTGLSLPRWGTSTLLRWRPRPRVPLRGALGRAVPCARRGRRLPCRGS